MRWIVGLLIVILLALQYRLWIADGGIRDVHRLHNEIDIKKSGITKAEERNQSLQAEVNDLKKGLGAAEERAREDLGMIKDNETFIQIIDDRPQPEPKDTETQNIMRAQEAAKDAVENLPENSQEATP
ncbi:MAG: cell division protein FtsB [Gammaproteobacteria bacterium]|nr:cell division protein FtsB [Gammaproteobacteria bacterium]